MCCQVIFHLRKFIIQIFLINNNTDLKGLFQIKCTIFVMTNLTSIAKHEKFITFIHEIGTDPKPGVELT